MQCLTLLLLLPSLVVGSAENYEFQELRADYERSVQELGLCRATSMAIETRESILQEQLSTCDTQKTNFQQHVTHLDAQISTLQRDRDASASKLTSERDSMMQMVTSLKEKLAVAQATVQEMELSNSRTLEDIQNKHYEQLEVVLSQNKRLEPEMQSLANSKVTLQKTIIELESKLEALNTSFSQLENDRATDNESSRQQIKAMEIAKAKQEASYLQQIKDLEDLLHSERKNHQGQLQVLEKARQERELEHSNHLNQQVQQALERGIASGRKQTSHDHKMLERHYQKLITQRNQLSNTTTVLESQVKSLKNELFATRHKLFRANERLRAPEIRRRLLVKRFQAVGDAIWAFIEPTYTAFLKDPLVDPFAEFVSSAWNGWIHIHYPRLRAEWKIIYRNVSEQMTTMYHLAHTETVNLWENHIQPNLKDAWTATAPQRQAIATAYEEHVAPHVGPLAPYVQSVARFCAAAKDRHNEMLHKSAEWVAWTTNLTMDYMSVQGYDSISTTLALIRHYAVEILVALEWIVAIAILRLFFRRRRCRSKTTNPLDDEDDNE